MALEFIADNRIRINSQEFRIGVFNPPMKDGNSHLLEATSDPANTHQQHLSVSELKGVLGHMLPKGFQIIIYMPETRCKGLTTATFENLSYGRRMSVSVYYYFEDWNYRINLIHFAEELRAKIENNIKNCQSTNFGKSEYGVNVECSVILEPSDDCYDVYSETDKRIYNLYKETIKNADRGFITKLEANQPQTDSGARWWVRYVIVPLISGGSGAALIGWMLLR